MYDQDGATKDAFGTTIATGAGGSIQMKSMIMTDAGSTSQLTMKVGVDVGNSQSGTFGAANAAYTAAVADKTTQVKNFEASAASSGAFTTYAALQADAYGLDGALGGGDDNATTLAFLNTADTDVTADLSSGTVGVVNRTLTGIKANTFNGLIITLQQLGGASGMDISMNNLALGSTGRADLGDIQIKGLNINGTQVSIYGH